MFAGKEGQVVVPEGPVEVARRELLRLSQVKALKRATGAWKPEDHPEFEKGAATWVKSFRSAGERSL